MITWDMFAKHLILFVKKLVRIVPWLPGSSKGVAEE